MLDKLNDDYIMIFPSIRAISIFDTINYDYFDMEVLGPSQRSYLIKKTEALGFKQVSGKWLTHADGTKIFFPPHKLFNRNLKSFIPSSWRDNEWLAVTPTQAAYLLMRTERLDEEDLYQLMMKHPFNLVRLGQAVEHEPFFGVFQRLWPELQRLFERAQIMLKNKLPLDKC